MTSTPARDTPALAGSRLGRAAVASGRGVRRLAARVADEWRRSLQLRVGATTVLVAGLVTIVIGVFLVDKGSGGGLRAKQGAAVDQAKIGINVAQDVLSTIDPSLKQSVLRAKGEIRDKLNPSSAGSFTIVLLARSGVVADDTAAAHAIPA